MALCPKHDAWVSRYGITLVRLGLGRVIRPFCIMLLYQYLLHYGLLLHIISQYLWLFSLIYKVYHEEGECRQLEFWLEKEQTLETYSALLQKS